MLEVRPITQKAAKAAVAEWHRHHKPPTGDVIRAAVYSGDRLVGVAMAGRPIARMLDDGQTLEIIRVATDGTCNACSKLYAAIRSAARSLGWRRVITYTLPEEGGASLRAAGFRFDGEAGGGRWSRPSREREDDGPTGVKWRWVWDMQRTDPHPPLNLGDAKET